jgi:hypothetical protein
VTLAAGFRHQLMHADAWHLDLEAREDAVGFSLGLRVTVGEEQIDLLPVIVAYLQDLPEQQGLAVLRKRLAEPTVFLPLSGGRVLPMASARLRAIVETLVELAADTHLSGGRLPLPMAQVGRLGALAEALPEWRWQGDGPLRDRARQAAPRPQAERLAAPPPVFAPRCVPTRRPGSPGWPLGASMASAGCWPMTWASARRSRPWPTC